MNRSLVWMTLLGFLATATPASAEPGVAILLDSRQSAQAELSARTRRLCYVLIKQNHLASQFSLKTIDLSGPEGREFAREFRLTGREFPALAYYEREGNRIHLRNLARNYKDPQKAAEEVFRCAQIENPELVRSVAVLTGVQVGSHPPGASVREAGNELGVTPCQLELPAGRHVLEIVQADCVPDQRTFNLKAGDNPAWSPTLAHYPTEVRLESTGPRLKVKLDGEPVGTTPVTLTIDAGSQELEATSEETFPIVTELKAEPNSRMLARLTPTPARVRVGWAGLDADGYDYSYTANIPIITDWGECASSARSIFNFCWSTPTVYSLPIPVDGTVDLAGDSLTQQAQGVVLSRPDLALQEVDQNWDCGLKIDLRSSEYWVIGELTILDVRELLDQGLLDRPERPAGQALRRGAARFTRSPFGGTPGALMHLASPSSSANPAEEPRRIGRKSSPPGCGCHGEPARKLCPSLKELRPSS